MPQEQAPKRKAQPPPQRNTAVSSTSSQTLWPWINPLLEGSCRCKARQTFSRDIFGKHKYLRTHSRANALREESVDPPAVDRPASQDLPRHLGDHVLARVQLRRLMQLSQRGCPVAQRRLRKAELEVGVPEPGIAVHGPREGKSHPRQFVQPARDRAGKDVRASAERVQPPGTVEGGKGAPGMLLPEPDRALRVELSQPWENE